MLNNNKKIYVDENLQNNQIVVINDSLNNVKNIENIDTITDFLTKIKNLSNILENNSRSNANYIIVSPQISKMFENINKKLLIKEQKKKFNKKLKKIINQY